MDLHVHNYYDFIFRTTYTRSIGLSRFMTATEKVRYTPDPEHPNETIAMKEIWIESGLYGLRCIKI